MGWREEWERRGEGGCCQALRAWLGPTVLAKVAAPRFLYCCSLEELGGRREEDYEWVTLFLSRVKIRT
jgi:hypothetical protein